MVFWAGLLFTACSLKKKNPPASDRTSELPDKFLVVLGIAQDAGYPQVGCTQSCCKVYWDGEQTGKQPVSLALVDHRSGKYWLFEATPGITHQLHRLQDFLPSTNYTPEGIFITHAHIGHYAGLMQLGREVMGTKNIPVWAMPRMDSFLRNNGPWSQLTRLENIRLEKLAADSMVQPAPFFSVTPVRVPHRDEYSETVGFKIQTPGKKILFIPDIDKWEKWDRDIAKEIAQCDMALLDGSFYRNGELPGRDMSEIPHPFVEESMRLLAPLSEKERAKVYFIHFNHTNPLLRTGSAEKGEVKIAGFGIAEEGMVIGL